MTHDTGAGSVKDPQVTRGPSAAGGMELAAILEGLEGLACRIEALRGRVGPTCLLMDLQLDQASQYVFLATSEIRNAQDL